MSRGKKCTQLHHLTGPANAASINESSLLGGSHGLCEARTRYIRVAIWYNSTPKVSSEVDLAEADLIGTFSILPSRALR